MAGHFKRAKAAHKKSSQIQVGGHIGTLSLLENGSPPYELRIDTEGLWFHEGVEIVRDDIRNYFSQHLVRDEDGAYFVHAGADWCPVVVEDTPFVVLRVTRDSGGKLSMLLSDGVKEPLAAETIEFRESNVPYCRARDGLEARFSRPAYYQLAEFIEYSEETDKFQITVDGRTITLEVA